MLYHSKKWLQTCLKWNSCQIIYNASLRRIMFSNKQSDHLVWMDMEMTGLEIDTSHILEVSCIITTSDLKIVDHPLNIVIHQPPSVLNNMNSWCKKHHVKSKLVEEVHNSKISLKSAEKMLLEYLKDHVPAHTCPMAGNSVFVDRMFLIKYMPLVNDYLHYRIVDVTSIKELVRRWSPHIYNLAPTKTNSHRALLDIEESIQELHYYRKHIFLP